MSKQKDTFQDSHGRTWPGPRTIDVFEPSKPDLAINCDVTDVDVARKLVQIRTAPTAFAWVDPSTSNPPKPKRPRKKRGENK